MQKIKSAIRKNPKLTLYYERIFKLVKMIRRLASTGAYMYWSYLVLDDKKVVYIVMRKVACTSIKSSMLSMESQERNNSVISHNIRRKGKVVGKLDPNVYKDYYRFTFVRNPFERLISCYENKYHTDYEIRKQDGKNLIFDAYLFGYLKKDRGFRAFAKRVCRIPDRISDHHFASQSFTIDRVGKGLQPDFVGQYEHLEEEYEPIRERFGFMQLPHHNKTPKTKIWMDYYDISTAQKVYKRYKEDIVRFGYQETYDKLIAYLKNREGETAALF